MSPGRASQLCGKGVVDVKGDWQGLTLFSAHFLFFDLVNLLISLASESRAGAVVLAYVLQGLKTTKS